MLLKRKKRIAALLMAVVMIFTAANFLPINTWAEEPEELTGETATGDASADETEAQYLDAPDNLEEDDITVYDLGNTISVYRRDPSVAKSDLFLDFGGTYLGSTPFIARDTSGHQTEAYCMQLHIAAPPIGEGNAVSYVEGTRNCTNAQKAANMALAMFAYGGFATDPNIKFWDTLASNPQDGGTYGTYLVSDGAGGIRAVRGLMIKGQVYEMSPSEARSITQTAVHAVSIRFNNTEAQGTDDAVIIGTVTGKEHPDSVKNAYNELNELSKQVAHLCNNIYGGNHINQTLINILNGNNRDNSVFASSQKFTVTVYNNETAQWEAYNSSDALVEKYKGADGNVKFKIAYSSYGLCNNIITTDSAGRMTVQYDYSPFSINGNSDHYTYFKVQEQADNSIPFTVTYNKITAGTMNGYDDLFTYQNKPMTTFNQEAVLTCGYEALQGNKLSVRISTDTAKAHTPYSGDGEHDGNAQGGARMFKNDTYQDTFFISPADSMSTSVTFAATAQANGSIQIHKYSANPEITDGNNCYSLKGAVFGIFRTRADAQAATEANENAVATITTDAAGNGSAGNLEYGTYYVKETKASPGYRVNTNIYMANIASDTPVVFNIPEEAGADPASVLVRKKNSEEAVYLEGAVFAIKYYDVQMTVDPATAGKQPVRTWYIKTDEDGFADLQNPDCVLLESDELYYRQDTGLPSIPIGTITVQEIEAPEGYIIDSTIHTFVINDNPEGIPHVDVENDRTIPNSPMQQPFELVKLGEGESENYPLADAGFSACRIDDLVEAPAGYTAASGEILVKDPETGKYYIWDDEKAVILTSDGKTAMFTDENGYAKSIPLNYGRYIVRETTVPKNFHAITAFVVTISENASDPVSMGYFVDKSFKAYLKIVKKDDATGKNILNNAAAFKIWSYDKNGYQTFTDSTGTKVTELKTDKEGVLMTPAPLMPGRYRIDEIANPEGYYTSNPDKTYDITIADDAVYKVYKKEDGTVTDMGVFEVEIENTEYKGVIGITKNGESRKYNETTGEFETEKVRLAGVTFKVYANEDIYAADGSGTLLIEKDALADTVVTDTEGYAASKELPLGTYRIEEDTPEGYVDMVPQFVTLTADGEKTVVDNVDGTRKENIRYELTIDNKLRIPKIHTTAKDTRGNKELKAEGMVTIIDTVYYDGLVPGKPYTVSGYPVYSDGDKLLADGKPVEVSLEFTPQSETGSVDVSYKIEASKLAGKDIVFFEYVYADNELIALHADISDKGQTITFLPDVPKTGDSAKPVIFVIIGMAALAGIVLLIRARRKIK